MENSGGQMTNQNQNHATISTGYLFLYLPFLSRNFLSCHYQNISNFEIMTVTLSQEKIIIVLSGNLLSITYQRCTPKLYK